MILSAVLLLIQLLKKLPSLTEQFVIFRSHTAGQLLFLQEQILLFMSITDDPG